ncbi:MAG: WG repeat-containing protein, partial [Ignavibacteria bacterium]|nr:WG repeat-containing protein [Ignavibacteria bacterium]
FFSENKFLRVEKDKLVGIIDSVGNVVIPCNYQNIIESNRSLFIATKADGLSGVIDDSNRTIIPFDYHGMEFHENYIIAEKKKDNETISGMLKYDGSILLSFMKGKLEQLSEYLIELTTEVKGKNDITPIEVKFIIDEKGKNVLPGMSFENLFPIYVSNKFRIKSDYINASNYEFFMNGDIIEYRLKSGIINSNGEIVIPFEYDDIPYLFNFNEKYIVVKNNERYGIIDFDNDHVLPIVYDNVFIQKNKDEFYFVVKDRFKKKSGLLKEPKYSYISSDYDFVIPFDYDWISVNDENYNWIEVYNNNRVGAIDFNNNIVIPIKYFDMLGLTEGLTAVKYVNPDSLNKMINSNKLKGTYYLEEIHHGLMFSTGGGGFPGIYKNPDYKYLGYTTLEIMNALSDTLSRHKYYESNYKYFENRYPTYEGFVFTIV